jgi:uncharacterized membrane protein
MGFQLILTVLLIPLIAWWMNISPVQAFLMGLAPDPFESRIG